MGKVNAITKDYMSEPKYFADGFNYYLFDGKQMIKPDRLSILDPAEMAIISENTSEEVVQKIRDVLKQCVLMTDGKFTYLILGIENQAEIHYAMPVRNMIYDALDYGKQVSDTSKKHREQKDWKGSAEFLSGFTKDDKLKPVITLTIYFGSDDWDGPRSLKEMFGEMDDDIMQFVEDYHLHLIVPKEIEDFNKFATDLGKVMKYIAISEDGVAIEALESDEAFREIDIKTVQLLNACTGSDIPIGEGKEDVNMCKGLEEMKERARTRERESLIQNALQNGSTVQEIAGVLKIPLQDVEEIARKGIPTV